MIATEENSLDTHLFFHYSITTMRKTKMMQLKKIEIEAAIEQVGGLEQLSDVLGLTSRQVRNYMSFEAAPKLAAERIRSILVEEPPCVAPNAPACAEQ